MFLTALTGVTVRVFWNAKKDRVSPGNEAEAYTNQRSRAKVRVCMPHSCVVFSFLLSSSSFSMSLGFPHTHTHTRTAMFPTPRAHLLSLTKLHTLLHISSNLPDPYLAHRTHILSSRLPVFQKQKTRGKYLSLPSPPFPLPRASQNPQIRT